MEAHELASEDSLRLHVLLASNPQAIRIDDNALVIKGLTSGAEREIRLNPNCRPAKYLKRVRELISGHVLGSPGGYPVFLKRWTRMGQMRDESLAQLLLLGEPEAVIAASCAPGLTDELAHRVWWCLESAETARNMLGNTAVVKGWIGRLLARYLIDHLPFEGEPESQIETVRLVLQPGLITSEERAELWKKGARKGSYLLGFLMATPDDLPGSEPPHPLLETYRERLEALAIQGNPYGTLLLKLLSPQGQAFLATARRVLKKPANQEVMVLLLAVLRNALSPIRAEGEIDATLAQLEEIAEPELTTNPSLSQAVQSLPKLREHLRSLRILSGVGYAILRPYLKESDAVGSLMQRKLETVITRIAHHLGLMS